MDDLSEELYDEPYNQAIEDFENAIEDLRNGYISAGELEILAAYLVKLREE